MNKDYGWYKEVNGDMKLLKNGAIVSVVNIKNSPFNGRPDFAIGIKTIRTSFENSSENYVTQNAYTVEAAAALYQLLGANKLVQAYIKSQEQE